MFQLVPLEYESIKFQVEAVEKSSSSQTVMTNTQKSNSSQIVMSSQKHRGSIYLPYAFTEQGVAMLSGVLNSDKAIKMNIAIMRAFAEVRRLVLSHKDIKKQLQEIKKRIGNHDVQLTHIYEAIENLLDEKAAQIKWENRERIGYKKGNE